MARPELTTQATSSGVLAPSSVRRAGPPRWASRPQLPSHSGSHPTIPGNVSSSTSCTRSSLRSASGWPSATTTTIGLVRIGWLAMPGIEGANQISATSASPSHVRAFCLGYPSSRHSIVTSGYAALKLGNRSPASIGGVMLTNPARSRPSCWLAQERAVAPASSTAASVAWAFSRNAAPARVTVPPGGWRSSNLTPTCPSSRAIACDNAGWASWSRWAARVIWPSCATVTKYRSCLRSRSLSYPPLAPVASAAAISIRYTTRPGTYLTLVLTLWNHRARQDQRYRGHALGPDQRRVSTG